MVERTIVEKRTCDICKAEITESFGGWNRIKIKIPTPMGIQHAEISMNLLDLTTYSKNTHQPDLCCNCVRKILTDYVNTLPISPTVTKK